MSCEPIGIISAGRFLREVLPEGTRVFVETEGNQVEEVSRISRDSLGALKVTLKQKSHVQFAKRVYEATPLYLSFIDLGTLDAVTVRAKARAVAVIPVARPGAYNPTPEEAPPYPNYWTT